MLSSAIWCLVHSVSESGGVAWMLRSGVMGRDTGRASVITVAASKGRVGTTVGGDQAGILGTNNTGLTEELLGPRPRTAERRGRRGTGAARAPRAGRAA